MESLSGVYIFKSSPEEVAEYSAQCSQDWKFLWIGESIVNSLPAQIACDFTSSAARSWLLSRLGFRNWQMRAEGLWWHQFESFNGWAGPSPQAASLSPCQPLTFGPDPACRQSGGTKRNGQLISGGPCYGDWWTPQRASGALESKQWTALTCPCQALLRLLGGSAAWSRVCRYLTLSLFPYAATWSAATGACSSFPLPGLDSFLVPDMALDCLPQPVTWQLQVWNPGGAWTELLNRL